MEKNKAAEPVGLAVICFTLSGLERLQELQASVKAAGENAGCREPMTDCREQMADCREPMTDCREQMTDCRIQRTDCREPMTDCREQMADYRLPMADCREQRTDCRIQMTGFCKCRAAREQGLLQGTDILDVQDELSVWTGEMLRQGHALLFIGACGIAVRAVAPYLTDKLQDRQVLVMDDQGRFIIPLLAGHMGGANELALLLSDLLGDKMPAVPVVTTATDSHGAFAADMFAKEQGMRIYNKSGIAKVSGKVLAGKEITLAYPQMKTVTYDPCGSERINADIVVVPEEHREDVLPRISEDSLVLIPKEYILGIGCKKGKSEAEIEAHVSSCMEEAGISWEQIRLLASADRKAGEPGILELCSRRRIPFLTYTVEELEAVPGDFHESAFVRMQLGVGNVCERAAVLAAGEGGRLVLEKRAHDGVTCAISRIRSIVESGD